MVCLRAKLTKSITVTVIITLIWLLVVSIIALISNRKCFYKEKGVKRVFVRLGFSTLVWFLLLAFMAGQMYWMLQLRNLCEQSSFALQFQNEYRSEINGTLNLSLNMTIPSIQTLRNNLEYNAKEIEQSIVTASVSQMITYLLAVIPIIDFVLELWSMTTTFLLLSLQSL